MKTKSALFILAFISLTFASCSRSSQSHTNKHTHIHKSIPPGHEKKLSGSKSAKPHAPGQKKKHKH